MDSSRPNPGAPPSPALFPASPGPSLVPCVCPACHGPLDAAEDAFSCRPCGRSYPRVGGGLNFLGEVTHEHTQFQRAIYEGDQEAKIQLSYQDREEYRRLIEGLFRHITVTGLPGSSMKDLMNGLMFERVGFARGMEVLDIGAGGGLLLNLIACCYGARGTGVDIAELALRRVLEFNPMELRFVLAEAGRLPYADGAFDRVISFDVLEHLPNQRAALREAARVVRPGGKLLFYVISAANDYTWHWACREATDGRVGVDDGGGHVRELFLDPDTTAAWLREAGFDAVEAVPFHAFFTLLIDERLQQVSQFFVRSPRLLRTFFALARAADGPWAAAGLGNGFYLVGTKGAA